NDGPSLAITATDADYDLLTYTAFGLPDSLTIAPSSGVISGTLTAQAAGTYPVTVWVIDSGGNSGSTSFDWIVAGLISPGLQLGYEGQGVALPIVDTDPRSDSYSFSATGLPNGLTIDSSTGLISGTPAAQSAGSYDVSVTASATDGTSSSVT